MKNHRVESAIGKILKEGMGADLEGYIDHLNPRERRRVLMCVANASVVNNGQNNIDLRLFKAITLLGFRDEEVLIFATAALGEVGNAALVPEIVERFCRNPKIARHELWMAARKLISNAKDFRMPHILFPAIECVRLYGEKLGARQPNKMLHHNMSTRLAGHILWVVDYIRNRAKHGENIHNLWRCDEIVKRVKNMTLDEAHWNRVLEEKVPLDGGDDSEQ